jgi:hypothetical protein
MVDIARATSRNITERRQDRRAAEMQERDLFERRRRDRGIEAAAEQFGDMAYAPTVFGQAQGVQQRGIRFQNELDDRDRELRQGAMRNALALSARMQENGVPPQQQAERAAGFLSRMGYDEQTIGAATQAISSGEMPAAQVLESVFGEEQRRAEYSGLQEVAGPDGQRMFVREVVQPDGSRQFVDVQGNPVEGFSPYEAPRRQSTAQTWRPLSAAEREIYGVEGQGYQISSRGNIRRIPGTGEGSQSNLFSAESRARIATNLPSLKGAFDNMRRLYGEGITFRGGDDAVSQGRNVAATELERIPFVGDDLGRIVSTTDRAELSQAASAYESALLPILSGAAVTDSEARRTIRGSIPAPGDRPEIVAIKLAQMNAMNSVFERGLEGEDVNFSEVAAEMRAIEDEMRAELGLAEDESVADGASDAPFEAPRGTDRGTLQARASDLGVDYEDVLYTAEQEGLTPEQVLAELEG